MACMKDVAPYGSSILIAYMIAFVDLCGFGLLLPLLPYYFNLLPGFGDASQSGIVYGCLQGAFSLGQVIGGVILGSLSDRWGRKVLLLVSLAGSAVFFSLTAIATTLPLLIACRGFAGLFASAGGIVSAYVSDVTTEATRSRYMGLLGGVFAAGFVSGPAIGGFLGSSFGVLLGFKVASYVAGGVCLLNLVFCFFFFRNADAPSPPEEKLSNDDNANDGAGAREKNDTKRESLWKGVRTAFRQRVLVALFVSTFFVSLCVTIMESAIALFLKDVYDYPEKYAGVLFAVFGVIMALTLIVAFQPLMRLVGPVNILRLAALLLAGLSASIPIVPSLNAIYVLLSGFAVANGVVGSSFSVLTSNLAKGSFGSVLGIRRSFGSLARALGPFLAGSLYDLTVLSTDLPHSIPFFVAGMSGFIAMCLLLSVPHYKSENPIVTNAELGPDETTRLIQSDSGPSV